MTTSPSVLLYAAIDGWRRQMVDHGHELLGTALDLTRRVREEIELIPDVDVLDDELLGAQASHDLDRMQVLIDVSTTGTSGYQAADWLRAHAHVDVGMSDHRRILATLSMADDKGDPGASHRRLARVAHRGRGLRPAAEHRAALARRDAAGVGRVAARRVLRAGGGGAHGQGGRSHRRRADHPVSPGIPAVVPGERLNAAVLDYLCSGVNAGMNLPDPADPSLNTIRVLA